MSAVSPSPFVRLLSLLGFAEGDQVIVCHKRPGRGFKHTFWDSPFRADVFAHEVHGGNVWFAINPMSRPVRKAEYATRLTCLWADLDRKPDGLRDQATCEAVLRDLSEVLGKPPDAVVDSGAGVQPYWVLSDGDDLVTARRVLELWKSTVDQVAANHFGAADHVFDMARVLRVPVTRNFNHGEPLPVRVEFAESSEPLTLAQVVRLLPPVVPKQRSKARASKRALASAVPSGDSVADFKARVARGEGRNNSLNAVAFEAGVRGLLTPELRRQLRLAAIEVGLGKAEVKSTLRSAKEAVERKTAAGRAWLGHVSRSAVVRATREPESVVDAAVAFALVWSRTGNATIGMAVRQVSEELGISIASAQGKIERLVRAGFLVKFGERAGVEAQKFQCRTPDSVAYVNNHPGKGKKELGVVGISYAEFVARVRRLRIRRHSAFQRSRDGSPFLPPTALDIALALGTGPMSQPGLDKATGRDRGTVDRGLEELESAGIVSAVDGLWELTDTDLVRALDRWVEAKGIPDRELGRRLLHEGDRQTFRDSSLGDPYWAALCRLARPGPNGRVSFDPREWPRVQPQVEAIVARRRSRGSRGGGWHDMGDRYVWRPRSADANHCPGGNERESLDE